MSKRTILGIVVILVGLFLPMIQERIPDITPSPQPDDNPLSISKPREEILEKVSSLADLVTDKEDRLRLCVFNKVFAERVKDYAADAQQINDVYAEAAKIFFGEALKGKYEGYGTGLVVLMKDSLGSENHTVTKEEKDKLSSSFSGLAWCFW
jgi:hypothetical protein